MKHTVYQIVYKSCYHGEIYDDPKAIALPPDAASCPSADILEVISVELPDDFRARKYRHERNGGMEHPNGIGSYFADKESAVAALRDMG